MTLLPTATLPEFLRPPRRQPVFEASAAVTIGRSRSSCLIVFVVAALLLPSDRAFAGCAHAPSSPKVLVLRGVFEVFSLGMNDLAKKLRCRGYDAKSTSWTMALHEAKCCDQRPLVVVGHSLGGRMCGWVPRKLRKCGKRVPLIIIVDANLVLRIPSNVDRCLHLHVTNPVGIFHGRPVRGESTNTDVVNWDISRGQPSTFKGGVNHFNIDATDWVHQIIINEIEASFPLASSTQTTNASSVRHLTAATGSRQASAPPEVQSGAPVISREQYTAMSARNVKRSASPGRIAWSPSLRHADRRAARRHVATAREPSAEPRVGQRRQLRVPYAHERTQYPSRIGERRNPTIRR